MLKRSLISLMAAICLLFPVYSAESGVGADTDGVLPRIYTEEEQELVPADALAMEDGDTAMAYLFLTSYSLMMEEKGEGGMLCFSDQGEYIAGFRMEGTPEDFFMDIPASTLFVPYALPTQLCAALFAGLDDVESVSRLKEYYDKGGLSCMLVTVLQIEGETISEDPVYSLARQRIERSAAASGLDIGPFYEAYESRGITETDLVNSFLQGKKTANDIALDAIRIIKENSRSVPAMAKAMPVFGIIGIVLGVIAITVAIAGMIIARKTSAEKNDAMDSDSPDDAGSDENEEN